MLQTERAVRANLPGMREFLALCVKNFSHRGGFAWYRGFFAWFQAKTVLGIGIANVFSEMF